MLRSTCVRCALCFFGLLATTCGSSDSTAPGGPAANCDSRCKALAVQCHRSNDECSSLCGGLTEGELSCLEAANCSSSAMAACGKGGSGGAGGTHNTGGTGDTGSGGTGDTGSGGSGDTGSGGSGDTGSGGAGGAGSGGGGSGGSCAQNCYGRQCGPDPVCGKSCGVCSSGTCNSEGHCNTGGGPTKNCNECQNDDDCGDGLRCANAPWRQCYADGQEPTCFDTEATNCHPHFRCWKKCEKNEDCGSWKCAGGVCQQCAVDSDCTYKCGEFLTAPACETVQDCAGSSGSVFCY